MTKLPTALTSTFFIMVHAVMVIFYPGMGIEVEHWLKMGETVHTRLAASPPFH